MMFFLGMLAGASLYSGFIWWALCTPFDPKEARARDRLRRRQAIKVDSMLALMRWMDGGEA